MSGERFDISSEPPSEDAPATGPDSARRPRQFLGVNFACCTVYGRIYVNRQGSAFTGNCPRCGRRIVVELDPDGPSDRFLSVS